MNRTAFRLVFRRPAFAGAAAILGDAGGVPVSRIAEEIQGEDEGRGTQPARVQRAATQAQQVGSVPGRGWAGRRPVGPMSGVWTIR